MEAKQTNNSKGSIALRLSQSELCKQITAGKFEEVSKLLPTDIKKALECPTVSDLIHAIGKLNVSLAVEYELCKMADLINVGGNLNGAQSQFIATQLVELFPAENLADFKICLQRGAMGQYGDIYRMDGVVIRKWMEQYLEEKYQTVEHQLMKEKDNMYKTPENPQPSDFNVYKEFLKVHGAGVGQKVPGLTREDVLRNGQSEPPKKKSTGHPPTSEEYVREWQSKQVEHRQKFLKDKYPNATDEEITEMI